MLTKWVESLSKRYYKVRWNYYKLRQLSLLQSAMDFTNCDSFFITKCDTVYYKLRQVLQSAMDLSQIAQILQSAMIITNCDSTARLRCLHRRKKNWQLVSRGANKWQNLAIRQIAVEFVSSRQQKMKSLSSLRLQWQIICWSDHLFRFLTFVDTAVATGAYDDDELLVATVDSLKQAERRNKLYCDF